MGQLQVLEGAAKSPLERSVDEYLASVRAGGKAIRTREHYTSVLLRIFLPWARRQGLAEPGHIDQAALDRFTTELLEQGGAKGSPLSPVSVHTYARTVNFYLAWCRAGGEVGKAKAQLPKLPRKVLETLERAEIRALEDAAPTERDKLIIRMLADTGVRISELLGLRPDDLIEKGRDRFVRVIGKGNKERLVPLPPALYARLHRYATKGRPTNTYSDRIFLGLRRRVGGDYHALDVSGAEQMLRQAAERAGIAPRKRVYPHLLRHSFITWALKGGMNPLQLARIVGHEDLTMINQVYAHLTASDAAEALMKLFRDEG